MYHNIMSVNKRPKDILQRRAIMIDLIEYTTCRVVQKLNKFLDFQLYIFCRTSKRLYRHGSNGLSETSFVFLKNMPYRKNSHAPQSCLILFNIFFFRLKKEDIFIRYIGLGFTKISIFKCCFMSLSKINFHFFYFLKFFIEVLLVYSKIKVTYVL